MVCSASLASLRSRMGHRAVFGTQDATVARGVVQYRRKHRYGVGPASCCHEFAQQFAGQQRHISVGDNHGAGELGVGVEGPEGNLHRASRAGMSSPSTITASGSSAETCSATRSRRCAGQQGQVSWADGTGGEEAWPTMERPPISWRIFGSPRFHSRPGTCSQDDDRCGPVVLGPHVLALLSVLSRVTRLRNAAIPTMDPHRSSCSSTEWSVFSDRSAHRIRTHTPRLQRPGAAITPERTVHACTPSGRA